MMTPEDRLRIVRAIVVAGMWGHSGVSHIVLEELDKSLPHQLSWVALAAQHEKQIRRDRVGVLDDEGTLAWYLSRGYWLTNWDDDGCSLFNPPPMNGLCQYVSKELSDKYKQGKISPYVEPPRLSYDEVFGLAKAE